MYFNLPSFFTLPSEKHLNVETATKIYFCHTGSETTFSEKCWTDWFPDATVKHTMLYTFF